MSDLLRGGLRTDHSSLGPTTRLWTKLLIESTPPFEKTRGVTECAHEPARHRSVLVFIRARERTHSSAPGLACVA